jgi:hypothetical protein
VNRKSKVILTAAVCRRKPKPKVYPESPAEKTTAHDRGAQALASITSVLHGKVVEAQLNVTRAELEERFPYRPEFVTPKASRQQANPDNVKQSKTKRMKKLEADAQKSAKSDPRRKYGKRVPKRTQQLIDVVVRSCYGGPPSPEL